MESKTIPVVDRVPFEVEDERLSRNFTALLQKLAALETRVATLEDAPAPSGTPRDIWIGPWLVLTAASGVSDVRMRLAEAGSGPEFWDDPFSNAYFVSGLLIGILEPNSDPNDTATIEVWEGNTTHFSASISGSTRTAWAENSDEGVDFSNGSLTLRYTTGGSWDTGEGLFASVRLTPKAA